MIHFKQSNQLFFGKAKVLSTILLCLLISASSIFNSSCKKKEDENTPVLTTKPVTDITPISAIFHLSVYAPSTMEILPYPIISKGFYWGLNPKPSIGDNTIDLGAGEGANDFDVVIKKLGANTTYYVRTYLVYEKGTIYGSEVNFTTPQFASILYKPGSTYDVLYDIDGNVYHTYQVGFQYWMADNLKVKKYRDGTDIPNVIDTTAWKNLSSGAYCDFNNAASNTATLGCLYNWEAVNNASGICPSGWHVPNENDWQTLETFMGISFSDAGNTGWRGTDQGCKMKEQGSKHWNSTGNNIGTNTFGLSIIPSGFRDINGAFSDYGDSGNLWSSTQVDGSNAWSRTLGGEHRNIKKSSSNKKSGYSVRCVKD